jgi:DNA topoisomerase-1
MGWSRKGRKGAFRYYDSGGKRITDESKLARIEALAIPPAWKDVSISPRSTAKLQATGFDAAGRSSTSTARTIEPSKSAPSTTC